MSKEELKKNVFMTVRWGVRLAPLLLMLAHWCLVLTFHHNPWEIVIRAEGNEVCLIAMWFMTWIFPMIILWCVGYLFEFGWMWKIPFGYALGVVMIRIAYWTLMINCSTKIADYILIVVALLTYWGTLVLAQDNDRQGREV